MGHTGGTPRAGPLFRGEDKMTKSRTNVTRRTRRAVSGRIIEALENRQFLDATLHDLSTGTFSQDWTNTGLITVNDNWSGVPSIIGYRGDNNAVATGADPQAV